MSQRKQAERRRSIWEVMRPTPGAHYLVYAEWAQAVHHCPSWHRQTTVCETCRPSERHPKHSIGSQRLIQRTVMSMVAMPRQPQGQSGRCSGRAHGDGWVSRARPRRWAHHSAASGSPLQGSHTAGWAGYRRSAGRRFRQGCW